MASVVPIPLRRISSTTMGLGGGCFLQTKFLGYLLGVLQAGVEKKHHELFAPEATHYIGRRNLSSRSARSGHVICARAAIGSMYRVSTGVRSNTANAAHDRQARDQRPTVSSPD